MMRANPGLWKLSFKQSCMEISFAYLLRSGDNWYIILKQDIEIRIIEMGKFILVRKDQKRVASFCESPRKSNPFIPKEIFAVLKVNLGLLMLILTTWTSWWWTVSSGIWVCLLFWLWKMSVLWSRQVGNFGMCMKHFQSLLIRRFS